ncbi:uncharacterized protein At5g39570-like [Corylus avellana]|uniref:uncharacterized protein At5g39570-like n=1 Tax=Corylus avellana TaxID=13451 RepID=UPI001E1F12D3|nr:uncharacterized protein At5g39570-like [Corylus avellana]
MAYYSSTYFEDDDHADHYYPNPYSSSYDSSPSLALMPYSSYESNKNNQFFEYNAEPASYSPQSYSSMAYYSSFPMEPRFLQYTQNPSQTQFVISYSTVDFDDSEFEEYDPTPYGGGYDLAQTYGKPLPPSDEICYPRDRSTAPADQIAVGSPSLALPSDQKEETDDGEAPKPGANGGHEEEKQVYGVLGEGSQENHGGDDYDKLVPQYTPSGYGLEAMDLCESLFGYWPCLAREKRRCSDCGQEQCADEGGSSAADYLFGSSYPYGERRGVGGGYGDPNYGYQMQYYQ